MSEQEQRLLSTDPDEWRTYWQEQGMPWRIEPEIDEQRQQFLAERRAMAPDLVHGVYPFSGIMLSRADIEWLLATHVSLGVWGPVVWDEEKDKPNEERRVGLDVRGAHLEGIRLELLPLARLHGGLSLAELGETTHVRDLTEMAQALDKAAVHLERAFLFDTELTDAELQGAHLEGADLIITRLEKARLSWAHFEFARLMGSRGRFLTGKKGVGCS